MIVIKDLYSSVSLQLLVQCLSIYFVVPFFFFALVFYGITTLFSWPSLSDAEYNLLSCLVTTVKRLIKDLYVTKSFPVCAVFHSDSNQI